MNSITQQQYSDVQCTILKLLNNLKQFIIASNVTTDSKHEHTHSCMLLHVLTLCKSVAVLSMKTFFVLKVILEWSPTSKHSQIIQNIDQPSFEKYL